MSSAAVYVAHEAHEPEAGTVLLTDNSDTSLIRYLSWCVVSTPNTLMYMRGYTTAIVMYA